MDLEPANVNIESNCILCLTAKDNLIKIFDETGIGLSIYSILTKHFWFEIKNEVESSKNVCSSCWTATSAFHAFYSEIERIHKENENLWENVDVIMKNESPDPLPFKQEVEEEYNTLADETFDDFQQQDNDSSSDDDRKSVGSEDEDWEPKSKKIKKEKEYKYNETLDDVKLSDRLVTCQKTGKLVPRQVKYRPRRTLNKYALSKKKIAEVLAEDGEEGNNVSDNSTGNHPPKKMIKGEVLFKYMDYITCDICQRNDFETYKILMHHFKDEHKTAGYIKCPTPYSPDETKKTNVCSRKLKRKGQIVDHMKWHETKDKREAELREKGPSRDEDIFKYLDKIKCHLCQEDTFQTFHLLTVHFLKAHDMKSGARLFCPKCNKSIARKDTFLEHMKKEDNLHCDICNIDLPTVDDLDEHNKIHSKKRSAKVSSADEDDEEFVPFRCKICDKGFEEENRYKKHYKTKHYSKGDEDGESASKEYIRTRDDELFELYGKLTCDICEDDNLELWNFGELKDHYKDVHQQEGYVQCCACDKKFIRRFPLMDHLNAHRNPENYTCGICKRECLSTAEFNSHKRRHQEKEKEKERIEKDGQTFQCEKCSRTFITEQRLIKHQQHVHSEKTLMCEICKDPNKLLNHAQMYHHMHNEHRKKRTFICEVCTKEYKTEAAFMYHKQSHDTSIVIPRSVCPTCGNTYKTKKLLRKHVRYFHNDSNQEVLCLPCNKMFANPVRLSSHKAAVHGKKSYPCTICGRIFGIQTRMKEHMTTHTGQQLYSCEFCPERFQFGPMHVTHRLKYHRTEWEALKAERLRIKLGGEPTEH